MRCRQCGFQIIEEGQPAGFCSHGCQEVYEAIKEMMKAEADRAVRKALS